MDLHVSLRFSKTTRHTIYGYMHQWWTMNISCHGEVKTWMKVQPGGCYWDYIWSSQCAYGCKAHEGLANSLGSNKAQMSALQGASNREEHKDNTGLLHVGTDHLALPPKDSRALAGLSNLTRSVRMWETSLEKWPSVLRWQEWSRKMVRRLGFQIQSNPDSNTY